MFDLLSAGDTFPGQVELVIIDHEGARQEVTFTAHFNRLEQTEINELVEAIRHRTAVLKAIEDGRTLPDSAKGVATLDDVHIADRVLGGWGEDLLAGDEPMDYDADTKRRVIEFEVMATAIATAWMKLAFEGRGKKQTSPKSRGSGIGK
jgi:hypothetical protein